MKISGRLEEKILFSTIKDGSKQTSMRQQAFIKAYDLYVDQIYRFTYFKVGNKEEAEDLSSAVFLKTWNYIQNDSLNGYKNLKPLLYKIARNLIIDHYRKINRQNNFASLNKLESLDLLDESQNIAKQTELAWDLTVVETKLPELKDEYREVIILHFVNELTIKEISEILNKSKGNVRVLIYRALNALRELVKE